MLSTVGPEAMLDPAVRNAQSAWSFVDAEAQSRFVDRLSADLDSRRLGRAPRPPPEPARVRRLDPAILIA